MSAQDFPALSLKRKEDRRIRNGHLWVYSNEVDVAKTPLKVFDHGQIVCLQDAANNALGLAYVERDSLICARVITRDVTGGVDQKFFEARIRRALSLRERLYGAPFYRLIYSESDGLPGVIVDRYGEYLSVQLNIAGADLQKDVIVAALQAVLQPKGMVMRNDSLGRKREGLESYLEIVGEVPERVDVVENGLSFETSLREGQKTGWFFDQQDNRKHLSRLVKDASVLDLYSFTGAWGITAAANGASQVVCIDSSPLAVELATANVARNQLQQTVEVLRSDVSKYLGEVIAEPRQFDVVIVDPPALIQRKKDQHKGKAAYKRINKMAMQALKPGGFLVSCSCSFHLSLEELQGVLLVAAKQAGREIQFIHFLNQSADHPVHGGIRETAYLKGLIARVTEIT